MVTRAAVLLVAWLARESVALSTGTVATPAALIQESLDQAVSVHTKECENGFDIFGRGSDEEKFIFTDDDFIPHAVGNINTGPEVFAKNGDVVFQTKRPLVSQQACQALIDEARQTITDRLASEAKLEDGRPTNSELGEARVSTLPKAKDWLKEQMHTTLFPLLQDRFGVDTQLTLHDALIIGYGYFGGGSRSQPMHRDSSILSLNVALSPCSDYVGGGTYFESLKEYLHQEQGHVTCHAGGTMHAGNGISEGERWVLVLFVLDEGNPQLARRCHSFGLEAQRVGDVELAMQHFDAALTVEPNNHLIYKDMGRSLMQKGDKKGARKCLSETTRVYPNDIEAALGLANMLVEAKKYRAALRRLDKVIQNSLSDSDMFDKNAWRPIQSQGFQARVLAARCAIQCAQYPKLYYSSMEASPAATSLLEDAMERIDICVDACPSPPPDLVQLMNMARFFSDL